MRRSAAALALSFLLAQAVAQAEPALDLAEAERLALENNRTLRASQAALDASRWAARSSLLSYLPTGAFTSSVTRVDDNTLEQANQAQLGFQTILSNLGIGPDQVAIDPFLYRDTYRSSFTVNQEFPLNLHLIGGSRLARAGERAARQGFLADRDALRLQVRQAYFRVLAARELLTVAEDGLAAAENHARLAAEREQLGMLNRADRLFWDATAAGARSDLAAARAGESVASMDLNRLLARPLDAPLELVPVADDALARAAALADEDPERLADRALYESPSARAIAAGDDAADAGRLLAMSGLTPSLHFSVNVGWRENDTAALDGYRSWSATALLNLPLLDLAGRWTDYRKAAADARRTHYAGDDAREQLRLAVRAACLEVTRSRESLAHREEAARQADATLALMQDRYTLGHISEYDLVDVQTADTAARAAAVQARYDHLAALATLESLVGHGGSNPDGDLPLSPDQKAYGDSTLSPDTTVEEKP